MFEVKDMNNLSKTDLYHNLSHELDALLGIETDFVANAANFSSLLFHTLPGLNWAGFYIHQDKQLVLGPFQGKPACIRIEIGKGVCGTAAAEKRTILVQDVHAFPGHIACDAASNSEIVVPVAENGNLMALLDLDSPHRARFDGNDQLGLEKLVAIFSERTDWRSIC
jgi:GAF domain-containing protein